MGWDRTNQKIEASYLNKYIISGTVVESRVKYGGIVQHTVQLDTPLNLFGTTRDRVLIDEPQVLGTFA